ncbi:methyl-accepting chemotaxis sensory transducer [Caballeronia calidae]|uniref:Methyl-accepting chemotaxis sensory transducer n=1 Tax=Caballeronia calidae TaxID=1777139 RepID=A0A158EIY0_9BURK|nr:methyl-accepting chemotaxis protein [Caballeronia calidae]SAL06733.1 methyl-accepting chemotaxis sensory transducer [Caballeronia calidae]
MTLSFSRKLWLPLILSLLCLLGMSIADAYRMRQIRIEERMVDLQHASEVVNSIVKTFANRVASGSISEDEGKKQALESIRQIRFGADGYFTVIDSKGLVLTHGVKPDFIGKVMLDYHDDRGTYLYREVIDVVKREGHGYVNYEFAKPGTTEQLPKLSYALAYPQWDWIYIVGVYVDDITADFYASLAVTFGTMFVLALVLGAIVTVLNRGILRSMGGEPAHAAEVANQIADNNLAVSVTTAANDRTSLMAALSRMQAQLLTAIGTVKQSAGAIASASGEIASGNTDLSSRTEEQAASLEETAASMEELTATVRQNSENARQASGLASEARGVAKEGATIVGEVVTTMASIDESSSKIADIIGIIEGIAFQTNILALNAAVEAARAGEQGRGFAVVATEVRSLAQRSSTAAKEIKALIEGSGSRVRAGTDLVSKAGETMERISAAVQRVTDIMDEIATASHEQTRGIEQVNQAIGQMDEVTQQNAALVEQAAAAAKSLQDQAEQLRSAMAVFKV